MLRPLGGAIIMALAALAMAACDRASPEPLTVAEDATVPVTVAEDATVRETVAEDATVPVTAADDTMVRDELQDRSFRQFEPHVDGDPRRGVIVSFFGPLSL